jgi:membrane fusion protein (multidrug efflux system)
VINAGLKPGERVIVDGVLKIGPGAPVNVTDPAAPKANGGSAKPAEGKTMQDKPAEKPSAKPAVKS